MKNAKCGVFTCTEYTTMRDAFNTDLHNDPKPFSVTFVEQAALADYKKNRLNGEIQDHPKRAFLKTGNMCGKV
jgi:hypothetical protein